MSCLPEGLYAPWEPVWCVLRFVSPEHCVGKRHSAVPLTQHMISPHYDIFLINATFSFNIRKQQLICLICVHHLPPIPGGTVWYCPTGPCVSVQVFFNLFSLISSDWKILVNPFSNLLILFSCHLWKAIKPISEFFILVVLFRISFGVLLGFLFIDISTLFIHYVVTLEISFSPFASICYNSSTSSSSCYCWLSLCQGSTREISLGSLQFYSEPARPLGMCSNFLIFPVYAVASECPTL